MRQLFPTILLLLIIAAVCHAADFKEISIERLPQLHDAYIPGGYQSNTYRLQNKGDKPANVTIREAVNYTNSLDYVRTRSMSLAPLTTAYLSLYSPQFQKETSLRHTPHYFLRDVSCRIEINGKRQELPNELLQFPVANGYSGNLLLGLVSPSLPLNDYKTLLGFIHENDIVRLAASPVEQWPAHVREYTGLSSIWISSEDKITPEVRQALNDFVHLGGTMITIVPPEARWPLPDVPEPNNCHVRNVGYGHIITVRPISIQNRATLQSLIQRLNAVDRSRRNFVFNEQERNRYPALESLRYFSFRRPELRDLNIPASFLETPPHTIPLFKLFLVMAVFAVIIGPLNYWYLQRKGKQLLLIFTTPVISILFCLFVFLFITFYEGWRSHGAACGFTLLDQTEHRADTFARVVVDAALRPSGGFTFSADDLVSFKGEGSIDVMDAPGQTIASSVMKPRVPLKYSVSRTEPRREQLDIAFNGNKATVTNGLGVKIASLVILSHDNILFDYDQPLQPGETITLNGTSRSDPPEPLTLPQIATTLFDETEAKVPYTATWLKKGQYLAKLDEPVFYSTGMKPDIFNVTHFIIGKF
ncbi:MAG: hypothetical protein IKZ46_15820 [Victivallales bacterium]|nr:hypothetical protein [Victivallales bacterium]